MGRGGCPLGLAELLLNLITFHVGKIKLSLSSLSSDRFCGSLPACARVCGGFQDLRVRRLSEYPVSNANELAIASVVNDFELQISRKERLAGTKCYRRELYPDFVE